MSYFRERALKPAKDYTAAREAEAKLESFRRESALNTSRAWLDDYRKVPRPSRFNWAPRWPLTPPTQIGIDYGTEKIIEGEFAEIEQAEESRQLAHADAAGEEGGTAASAEAADASG